MLVSLATNPTRVEPRVEELVPPLAMGRTPVTLVVRSMVELVMSLLTISDDDNKPADELWTTPAELNAEMVGAWATVRFVIVVVARVEVPAVKVVSAVEPVTARAPPTVRRLEMVVEPVMARVLDVGLKVKFELVAKVLLPWPNKISLAVRFCN